MNRDGDVPLRFWKFVVSRPDPMRAVDRDRHDRGAGPLRQPDETAAEGVDIRSLGPLPLREDPHASPGAEDLDRAADAVAFAADGIDGNGAKEPHQPADDGPVVREIPGEIVDGARDGHLDEDRVQVGGVIRDEDHRPRRRDVPGPVMVYAVRDSKRHRRQGTRHAQPPGFDREAVPEGGVQDRADARRRGVFGGR